MFQKSSIISETKVFVSYKIFETAKFSFFSKVKVTCADVILSSKPLAINVCRQWNWSMIKSFITTLKPHSLPQSLSGKHYKAFDVLQEIWYFIHFLIDGYSIKQNCAASGYLNEIFWKCSTVLLLSGLLLLFGLLFSLLLRLRQRVKYARIRVFSDTHFPAFFFLFFILRRYKFLICKFTNSTMNINSYTN